MKKFKIFLVAFCAFSALICSAVKVGEQAPKLQVSEWIKNGPTKLADGKGKNIYIIEFWATSCKPCLKAIPYIHKLQQEYKEQITVISISTENAETVKNFIKKHEGINYKIAVDDSKKTYNSYVKGNGDIPIAFIVDKSGTVSWIGHPMDMSLPLKRIITGKFDIKESEQRQKIYRKIQVLLGQKKYTEALGVTEAELDRKPDNVQFMALKSFILFQLNKKEESLKFTSEMLKKHPMNMELFDLKAYILTQMKKYKELDSFYLQFINNCKDEPMLLNQLARQLLGTRFGEAKLAPALKAAELAYSSRKLYKVQRADVGETLARIYYMTGNIDRAIKIQNVVCRILKKNKKPRYVYAVQILGYYQRAYSLGQGKK